MFALYIIRYIYFTDWGKNPQIERAWMDGQNRKVLIDRDLGWPNGLVIDKPTGRMIWADANMEVCGLFGGEDDKLRRAWVCKYGVNL